MLFRSGLVPEERRKEGLFCLESVCFNLGIASLKQWSRLSFLSPQKMAQNARTQIQRLGIKTPSPRQRTELLSGGNQQKVLISKWLCCCPEVIIFDEPTRGIDVGAKAEIYKVMRQLADDGKVILMVSSELPEIITVCDRIAVFCEGRLTQILTNRDDMSEEEIMAWALPQE